MWFLEGAPVKKKKKKELFLFFREQRLVRMCQQNSCHTHGFPQGCTNQQPCFTLREAGIWPLGLPDEQGGCDLDATPWVQSFFFPSYWRWTEDDPARCSHSASPFIINPDVSAFLGPLEECLCPPPLLKCSCGKSCAGVSRPKIPAEKFFTLLVGNVRKLQDWGIWTNDMDDFLRW